MTDERGGRYFREARFFLAGDKVAAQSHILEARSLMGYMRDMQAMGGPPIQVKYATLRDGTRIKATMMNGQYQAEIISPAPNVVAQEKRQLTIVGIGHDYGFKWQASTGVVSLPPPEGYRYSAANQVSYDGDLVLGDVFNVAGHPEDGSACVWDNNGTPTLIPPRDWSTQIRDITNGSTELLQVPYAPTIDYELVRHRFDAAGDHIFMGYTNTVGPTASGAMAVRRDAVTGGLTTLFVDTAPINSFTEVYKASRDGNVIVGAHSMDWWTGPYTYSGNGFMVWERADAESAYVPRVIPDLFTNQFSPSVSDDGKVFLGDIERARWASETVFVVDSVPAIYTDAYGILQLHPWQPDPVMWEYLWSYGIKISSDGTAAIGNLYGAYPNYTPYGMAWQNIDPAAATFETIPDLHSVAGLLLTDIN